jgi:DNA-binding MarR family transcriptional regulator
MVSIVGKSDKRAEAIRGARSPAFLLAQVGAHAATQFGKNLDEIKLTRPHAGVLRIIAARPGLSQQELATVLSVVPSRLVILVDELEERGLVERRDHPGDRRVYAVHLTQRGGQAMADIGRIAKAHNDATCAAPWSKGSRRESIPASSSSTPTMVHGLRRVARQSAKLR